MNRIITRLMQPNIITVDKNEINSFIVKAKIRTASRRLKRLAYADLYIVDEDSNNDGSAKIIFARPVLSEAQLEELLNLYNADDEAARRTFIDKLREAPWLFQTIKQSVQNRILCEQVEVNITADGQFTAQRPSSRPAQYLYLDNLEPYSAPLDLDLTDSAANIFEKQKSSIMSSVNNILNERINNRQSAFSTLMKGLNDEFGEEVDMSEIAQMANDILKYVDIRTDGDSLTYNITARVDNGNLYNHYDEDMWSSVQMLPTGLNTNSDEYNRTLEKALESCAPRGEYANNTDTSLSLDRTGGTGDEDTVGQTLWCDVKGNIKLPSGLRTKNDYRNFFNSIKDDFKIDDDLV